MRIVKTYVASGAIPHRRQVKFTANDGEVTLATAATDVICGVTDFPNGAADKGRVDVVLFGPAEVECGGTMSPATTAGFTSDANGKAVAAAPGAGVNHYVGGRVLVNAVSGDIAKVIVNPDRIQG
jgi:hypothetical protein